MRNIFVVTFILMLQSCVMTMPSMLTSSYSNQELSLTIPGRCYRIGLVHEYTIGEGPRYGCDYIKSEREHFGISFQADPLDYDYGRISIEAEFRNKRLAYVGGVAGCKCPALNGKVFYYDPSIGHDGNGIGGRPSIVFRKDYPVEGGLIVFGAKLRSDEPHDINQKHLDFINKTVKSLTYKGKKLDENFEFKVSPELWHQVAHGKRYDSASQTFK